MQLGILGTLAHGDDARGNSAFDELAGCPEQVRIVLLRTEVGDRADDELVGSQAQLGPDLVAVRQFGGGCVDVDAVPERDRPRSHGTAHRFAHFVGHGEGPVVEAARETVEGPGRCPVRLPTVVLGADQRRPPVARQTPCGDPGDRARER